MTERHKALVTAPFRGEGWDTLNALTDVVYDPWIEHVPLKLMNGEKLAARLVEEGADILIVESDSVKGPVFDLDLKLIGSCRGDPNNFIVPADHDVRADQVYAGGKIPYQRYRAWQLAGRTAGIIGLGAVGRAAKWRFEGLGMNVLAYDPYNPEATHHTADELQEMLAECDVVSMHAMVTPETERLMSAPQFAAMKPGSIYVNSARALLHDTDALVAALQSGHLAGAGLDHFEGEHLAPDHPLCAMNNVVLTPHIGGATYDTEANHSKLIADDVGRILRGEKPVNCVNPEVLD